MHSRASPVLASSRQHPVEMLCTLVRLDKYCTGLAKSSIAETAKKHGQLIGIAFYMFQVSPPLHFTAGQYAYMTVCELRCMSSHKSG
jgi:hypothetical protein